MRSEFALQTQGLAEAFLHPDVVNAVRLAGRHGVAVSVVHWAGAGAQATVVDWHRGTRQHIRRRPVAAHCIGPRAR
jgi:hypothetical protein